MPPAKNNQLSLRDNYGTSITVSDDQYSMAVAAHQLIHKAAEGTPMAVKKTKNGFIVHKAKICSVCTDDVSSDTNYYHCGRCHHEICQVCWLGNRGCDKKKGHSIYVYKV